MDNLWPVRTDSGIFIAINSMQMFELKVKREFVAFSVEEDKVKKFV